MTDELVPWHAATAELDDESLMTSWDAVLRAQDPVAGHSAHVPPPRLRSSYTLQDTHILPLSARKALQNDHNGPSAKMMQELDATMEVEAAMNASGVPPIQFDAWQQQILTLGGDEDLRRLKVAWFYAGYYSGVYAARNAQVNNGNSQNNVNNTSKKEP